MLARIKTLADCETRVVQPGAGEVVTKFAAGGTFDVERNDAVKLIGDGLALLVEIPPQAGAPRGSLDANNAFTELKALEHPQQAPPSDPAPVAPPPAPPAVVAAVPVATSVPVQTVAAAPVAPEVKP